MKVTPVRLQLEIIIFRSESEQFLNLLIMMNIPTPEKSLMVRGQNGISFTEKTEKEDANIHSHKKMNCKN